MSVVQYSTEPGPTIIMPYYELGNLKDFDATDEQLAAGFAQVLEGIAFLHARNVVHRDMKAENILVASAEPFKLIISDFGFSKQAVENQIHQTFCGTLYNVAAEVIDPISTGYSMAADTWSVGMIFLEAFWGSPKLPDGVSQDSKMTPTVIQKMAREWPILVVEKLEDLEDDLVVQVLAGMLRIDSSERSSAIECLEVGEKNGLWQKEEYSNSYVLKRAADCDDCKGRTTPLAVSPK